MKAPTQAATIMQSQTNSLIGAIPWPPANHRQSHRRHEGAAGIGAIPWPPQINVMRYKKWTSSPATGYIAEAQIRR